MPCQAISSLSGNGEPSPQHQRRADHHAEREDRQRESREIVPRQLADAERALEGK
jgi:hypothetical protein